MRRNNKGFSLAELLVSFAILGMVATILGAIMVSGSNVFASNKKVLNLQYKSQVSSAQLHSYIQNCDAGVAVAENGDLYLACTGTTYVPGPASAGGQNGNGHLYVISKGDGSDAMPDEDKLYLRDVAVTISTAPDNTTVVYNPAQVDLDTYTPQPICSEVDSWNVTIGKEGNVAKHLKVEIVFKRGNTVYASNISEAFRSRPLTLSQTDVPVDGGMSLLDYLKTQVWR